MADGDYDDDEFVEEGSLPEDIHEALYEGLMPFLSNISGVDDLPKASAVCAVAELQLLRENQNSPAKLLSFENLARSISRLISRESIDVLAQRAGPLDTSPIRTFIMYHIQEHGFGNVHEEPCVTAYSGKDLLTWAAASADRNNDVELASEIMTQLAMVLHLSCFKDGYESRDDAYRTHDLYSVVLTRKEVDASPTISKDILPAMWNALEFGLERGYISLFFYIQAKGAKANGTWKLSLRAKVALDQMERCLDQRLRYCKSLFVVACENQCTMEGGPCQIRAASQASAKFRKCNRCNAKVYCSVMCQLWDWKYGDHRLQCTPINNRQPAKPNSNASGAANAQPQKNGANAGAAGNESPNLQVAASSSSAAPGASSSSGALISAAAKLFVTEGIRQIRQAAYQGSPTVFFEFPIPGSAGSNARSLYAVTSSVVPHSLRSLTEYSTDRIRARRIAYVNHLAGLGFASGPDALGLQASELMKKGEYIRAALFCDYALDLILLGKSHGSWYRPSDAMNETLDRYIAFMANRLACIFNMADPDCALIDQVIADCGMILQSGAFTDSGAAKFQIEQFKDYEKRAKAMRELMYESGNSRRGGSSNSASASSGLPGLSASLNLPVANTPATQSAERVGSSSLSSAAAAAAAAASASNARNRRRKKTRGGRTGGVVSSAGSLPGASGAGPLSGVFAATSSSAGGPVFSEVAEILEPLMYRCSQLRDMGLAFNAQSHGDACPVCHGEWRHFRLTMFAIVGSCRHAVCVSCLSEYSVQSRKIFETEMGKSKTEFGCPICREPYPDNMLERFASDMAVDHGLLEAIGPLARMLYTLKPPELRRFVAQMLIKHKFDIERVQEVLFNMYVMVSHDENAPLQHEKKQEIFQTARRAVKALEEEYYNLRTQLNNATSREDVSVLQRTLEDVSRKLQAARENAAADIFERMNAAGLMGAQMQDVKREVHVDLHGLYGEEALDKIQECILPLFPAIRSAILITGRGAHSRDGPVLKRMVKEFFDKRRNLFDCNEVIGNPGALRIVANKNWR